MLNNRTILHLITAGMISTLLSGSNCEVVFAINYDEVVELGYEELVVNKNNKFSFEYDGDLKGEFSNVIKDIQKLDKEDTLFDGIMLKIRGTWVLYKTKGEGEPNKYTISINRAYNIDEADALTDRMLEEIKEGLPEDATDKDKFYAITKYVEKTYDYDKKEARGAQKYKNFVEAYDGERKINCQGFASVLYLLYKKMGLDTTLFLGKEHVYNGIRFDDGKYMVVDLSCDGVPLGYAPGFLEILPMYNGNRDVKRYASIPETIAALGYEITHW